MVATKPAPTERAFSLEQEFKFIDGLNPVGGWNDKWPAHEPRTECKFNPWPKPNLSRIALLEKYADIWVKRVYDLSYPRKKLRESTRTKILTHIEDLIENIK